jgi:hypothetical protein
MTSETEIEAAQSGSNQLSLLVHESISVLKSSGATG